MAGDHNQLFDTDFITTQSRTVLGQVDAELCLIVFGIGSNAAQLDNVVTFLGKKENRIFLLRFTCFCVF